MVADRVFLSRCASPIGPCSLRLYPAKGKPYLFCEGGKYAMLKNTIAVQSQSIRTDWINKIQRGTENGTPTGHRLGVPTHGFLAVMSAPSVHEDVW